VLVVNFGSPEELKACAWFDTATVQDKFPVAFRLTTPLYENAIGAFLRQPSDLTQLRKQLAARPELDTGKKSCRLNFSIRGLKVK
jgi:hypothetical protein